jgi:hypothetical protein
VPGGLDTRHPLYELQRENWEQLRDTAEGQRAVKAREGGIKYLPPTAGMWADSGGPEAERWRKLKPYSKGWRAYQSYLARGLFIPFLRDSADMILGMLWNKPPQVALPAKMEFVRQKVSPQGEGLLQLMRLTNYQQIVMGQCGTHLDLPSDATRAMPQPYISLYHAEDIINWASIERSDVPGEALKMVVLDECTHARVNMFDWQVSKRYRVLALGDLANNSPFGVYNAGIFEGQDGNVPEFDHALMRVPSIRGRALPYIPFVFIGAVGNTSGISDAPLLGLSDISLAIYRMQADYRQALFMNTQDTMFTKGFQLPDDAPLRLGAGAHVHSDYPEADMKYVGTNSQGLPELRQALETDLKLASHKAGELMDASSRARESGVALEMRVGTKTATLNSIALAMGEGFERQLKSMAIWLGLNPDEVKVQPNFEFASREFSSQDLNQLVAAKMLGGPISYQSIHKWSVDRGYTKLTWEEMVKEIQDEEAILEMLQPLPEPQPDPPPGESKPAA